MSFDVVRQVRRTLAHHAMIAPGARVIVAVSGGADSLALLELLHSLADEGGWTLHVATLDHGLRGAVGAADADFVRATAQAHDLPVTVGRADVLAVAAQTGLGIEAAARGVRYAFLLRLARHVGADAIAVGHTQDDQAETVLLHLIRGSGLRGLRGMLPVAPLTAAYVLDDAGITFDPSLDRSPAAPDRWPVLIRPLIDTPRAAIDAHLTARGLTPRQDATNADPAYLRNRIRHEVLPLLAALNPEIRAGLARTADLLRADADLVDAAGRAALEAARLPSNPGTLSLERAVWADFSQAEKRLVLRAAVQSLRSDEVDLAFVHVEDAIQVADRGAVGASATLPGGLALRVDYAALVIGLADADPAIDAPLLDPQQALLAFAAGEVVGTACGAWRFEAQPLPPGTDLAALLVDPLAAALCVLPQAALELRVRRAGDRFAPHGMGGQSQKLADTLINMKVPARVRDRVPLVTVDGAVAWFVAPTADGVRGRVADPYAFGPARCTGKQAIIFRWRRLNYRA
ncbi:tRNA lysidine(34) synthetase TilS [Aggregatilinea lenta]|uniref:tRNA lysidine(34) synthetase TilS n=1 Tax=Aggregatilinea lenta TaxID=913108 RepID=UPI000E5B4F86|nr:tRNA lysidine(34) synthetase TilS [Aggregatilinea lenta]